jgi:hypothetical protein
LLKEKEASDLILAGEVREHVKFIIGISHPILKESRKK